MKWLPRDLIAGPYLCLALSEKAYNQALNDLGRPKQGRDPWILNGHSDATVHLLQNTDGGLAAVVCLRGAEARSGVEIAGLLVHEAVHIWQVFCERIGEDSPSKEFEAYSIQRTAQSLMASYAEQAVPK
jgi:hypothetical protein